MIWSVSKSAMFKQCPRKWYYSQVMASRGIKNAERRQVYLLNQLQSAYAWRGNIVDKTISDYVVPFMNRNTCPNQHGVIAYAMQLMEKQLAFAKERTFANPATTKTASGDKYCALYEIEYGKEINEELLESLRQEIKTALNNFLGSELIKELTNSTAYLVTQRSLRFKYADNSVTCTPDLIAFYDDKSPLIVDWKVHAFGIKQYWLQLGIYALALSLVTPHRDFTNYNHSKIPTQTRLLEYQLLSNQQREYSLNDEDIIELEDYMYQSIEDMNRLVDGKKYGHVDMEKFRTAQSPSTCSRCNFRKVCWEDGGEA
ncbi:MAG: hypothetical protein DRO96_01080 [Candidatus Aenigmatarchaeota archaeon]|nr:MAG: hypothetical protein DRO96_01080 [Candidatus Aenigmarchaeota archaeon]